MEGIFICGIVFFAIYKIIELFVQQKERKLMINKLSEVSPEMMQTNINSLKIAQNTQSQSGQFLMLRLGGVALGIGAGWILGWVLNFTQLNFSEIYANGNVSYRWKMESMMDSTYIATTALCTGIALIIVYLIERKAYKEAKKAE